MMHTLFNKKSGVYLFLLMASLLALVACGGGAEEPAESNEPTAVEEAITEESNESETADTETAETASEEADTATSNSENESGSETSQTGLPLEGKLTLEKTAFAPGDLISIKVEIEQAEDSDAWIGIIPSSVPHGSEAENDEFDLSYVYAVDADDAGMVTLYAPLEDGAYDVRLFNTDSQPDGIELDSVSITVGDVEGSGSSETAVASTESTGEETVTSEEAGTEGNEENTDDETADAGTNNGGGNDSCLVGTWRVSNFDAYFAASVAAAMAGQDTGGVDIEITSESSGDLLLTFDGETMTMRDNNFTVTASMMGVSVPTAIDASGSASYTADGTTLEGYVDNVNVQESTGFGINLSNLTGEKITYTCAGDGMSWSGPYAIPIEFTRTSS